MSSTEDESRLDPAAIGELYQEFAGALRAFLIGLLRNRDLADEALQSSFAKAVRRREEVQPATFRGWLFQVAYHEAMAIRRRHAIEARAIQKLSVLREALSEDPGQRITRGETIRRVQKALEVLPAEQRDVVRRRIYEGRTFAEIAAQSNLPLGTVLTRMRLALNKLRQALHEPE